MKLRNPLKGGSTQRLPDVLGSLRLLRPSCWGGAVVEVVQHFRSLVLVFTFKEVQP